MNVLLESEDFSVDNKLSYNKWTREETILAYELYCTLPAAAVTVTNQDVINLAAAIGRTAASVKLKLQNFKAFDPIYTENGRIGLKHGSKLDAEISTEFFQNTNSLVCQASEIKRKINLSRQIDIFDVKCDEIIGYDEIQLRKTRYGQSFFRKALMASYNGRCCITGLSVPALLRASHIKPWAALDNENAKVNPSNGLLLNALFDAAFDTGLISINTDYKVMISGSILNHSDKYTKEIFLRYRNAEIEMPSRFSPNKQYLEYHNDVIFIK